MAFDQKKHKIVQRYLQGKTIAQIVAIEQVNPKIVSCVIKKYIQFPHRITKKCNCSFRSTSCNC